jgi:fluoroquinolone resistance protein
MEHSSVTFSETVFSGQDLTQFSFEDCIFDRCDFTDAQMMGAQFLDCTFKACNLSNVNLRNGSFRNINFQNCKLLGVQWGDLKSLMQLNFEECNLSYNVFSGVKLKKTRMTQCTLREAEFLNADFSESDFQGSDFLGARFMGTALLKADFRDAKNYSIDPTSNKIRGAKFSVPEVMGLLDAFGIEWT